MASQIFWHRSDSRDSTSPPSKTRPPYSSKRPTPSTSQVFPRCSRHVLSFRPPVQPNSLVPSRSSCCFFFLFLVMCLFSFPIKISFFSAMDDSHKMGFVGATSYVIGNIIGSGIFITPASILRCTNSVGLSLLVWLACSLIAILGKSLSLFSL